MKGIGILLLAVSAYGATITSGSLYWDTSLGRFGFRYTFSGIGDDNQPFTMIGGSGTDVPHRPGPNCIGGCEGGDTISLSLATRG